MCGIFGMVGNGFKIDIDLLVKSRDLLYHRGPDDAGIWVSKNGQIGLAQRRLSILDLSPLGHQPMISEDGRFIIVYNGELYNFKELRKELENLGEKFVSSSDTEVVLKSYIQWGSSCVNFFNGMFAFVIYDHGDEGNPPILFMARDRVGKKPFYYKHDSKEFIFSSEMKAINCNKELDIEALNFYLALGYVPGEKCIVKGIKKLPPANAAILKLNTFEFTAWNYWEVPKYIPEIGGKNVSLNDLVDELEGLFKDAVERRMISDVPLGVFLSGGLDSSLVTAAASRANKNIMTFNISFPGSKKYDEASHARLVSDFFSTDHKVLNIPELDLSILEEILHFSDEPIADSSIIPTFVISKLTREYVTVVLGGDGGDELFAGYTHYRKTLQYLRQIGWVPQLILKGLGKLASEVLPVGFKGRTLLQSLMGGNPIKMLAWYTPYFDAAARKKILSKEVISQLGDKLIAPELWKSSLLLQSKEPVEAMTRADILSYLPDDIMFKVDRASMYNSLEVRAPFLDYRLVEFAFKKVPHYYKADINNTRIIERELAKKMLPPDFNTNRKQGFSIPLDEWFRSDKTQKYKEYLPIDNNLFNKRTINDLIRDEMAGSCNGARIFSLIMLNGIK
ncbi:MAG: asparagine synthase (glutamine-hydrolyzing) [Bacillota bacterium]